MKNVANIRKVFLLTGVFLLFWFNDTIAADNSVGIVIATQGKVYAEVAGGKRLLQRSNKIFLHEIISTQDNSSIQIRLNDNSVLSLKPNTKYSIKEFNLDKKDPKNSNYVGGLVSGVLISLSGDISNHSLKIPVASITIRGTLYESGFITKSRDEGEVAALGYTSVPKGELHLSVGDQKGDITSADPSRNASIYTAIGNLDSSGGFQPNLDVPVTLDIMSEKDMREKIDEFEAMSEEEEDDVDMDEVEANDEDASSEEVDIESDDDSVEDLVKEVEEEIEEEE